MCTDREDRLLIKLLLLTDFYNAYGIILSSYHLICIFFSVYKMTANADDLAYIKHKRSIRMLYFFCVYKYNQMII